MARTRQQASRTSAPANDQTEEQTHNKRHSAIVEVEKTCKTFVLRKIERRPDAGCGGTSGSYFDADGAESILSNPATAKTTKEPASQT